MPTLPRTLRGPVGYGGAFLVRPCLTPPLRVPLGTGDFRAASPEEQIFFRPSNLEASPALCTYPPQLLRAGLLTLTAIASKVALSPPGRGPTREAPSGDTDSPATPGTRQSARASTALPYCSPLVTLRSPMRMAATPASTATSGTASWPSWTASARPSSRSMPMSARQPYAPTRLTPTPDDGQGDSQPPDTYTAQREGHPHRVALSLA